MNQKKSKLIRRMVRSLGHVKADFPLHHYDMKGRLVSPGKFSALFGGVLTARYPDQSFQRKLRELKRAVSTPNFSIKFLRHALRATDRAALAA